MSPVCTPIKGGAKGKDFFNALINNCHYTNFIFGYTSISQ